MDARRFWTIVLSLSLLVLGSGVFACAQSTYGSIAGSVTDTSGATITDANVTLTNLGTAEKRTQSSGSDGLFTLVNLFPGQYRIDVEKQGFKHFVRTPDTVEVHAGGKRTAAQRPKHLQSHDNYAFGSSTGQYHRHHRRQEPL